MTAGDWSRLLHLSLDCGPEVRFLVGRAFADTCRGEEPPDGYIPLAEAAKLAGITKGSMHHAVTRGAIRSHRIMPPAGRTSVLLYLNRADVEAYKPRPCPRRKPVKRGR